MFKKIKKHFTTILLVGVAILCVFLIFFVVAVLDRYSGTIEEKITEKAALFSVKTDATISEPLVDLQLEASKAAGMFEIQTSSDAFQTSIIQIKNEFTSLKDLRYVKNGIIYDSNLQPVENYENYSNLITEATSGKVGAYGILFDTAYQMNLIAFYAPVKNNPNLDAVIMYYNESSFMIENFVETIPEIESADFVVVCTRNGRIVHTLYPDSGTATILTVRKNLDILKEINENLSVSTSSVLSPMISGTDNSTTTFMYNGERFAFSVTHNTECKDLVTCALYRANNLDGEQDDALAAVGAILVFLCIAVPTILLIVMLSQKIAEKKEKQKTYRSAEFQCYTLLGMQQEIPINIQRFPGTKYAIVGARLKHYRYIADTYPKKVSTILHGIRDFLYNNLELGEILSTGDEGEFVLMVHFRSMDQLKNRLLSISNLISNKVGSSLYQVRLDFGVYEILYDSTTTPKEMIQNAFKAIDAEPSKSGLSNVTIFSDVFHENYLKSAEIEVKMDLALEKEEFKVFFQPKLNVIKNTIDGCEALVRWYDEEKGEYRRPGTFLPLFEQNGFISKLDKFVFAKACEFIGLRLSQNLPVFPTSVNISRTTVLDSGFMEYYASIKNKYGVPDNFITLELSESVAANSFQELNAISTAIHNNKFLISIDDYGSGYSSFNVLKSIRADEIKIDRMFLEKGINAETDEVVLSSIIKLAKELGIKTVQEGVETKEQLDYVRRAGCNVVQGYWLSKPLSMLDYIKFIDTRTQEDELRARSHSVIGVDD